MKIKSIDDLSLEELKEIIDNNYYDLYNVQESEIRKRYDILQEQDRLINPVFITKEEFLRRNPKYNEVIGRGLFGREKRRNSRMLHFYDVEDTEREHRIVRSACERMSIYRFSNNIIQYYGSPLAGLIDGGYNFIKYIGDGAYYVKGGVSMVVNVLDPNNPRVLATSKNNKIRILDNNIIEIEDRKGRIRCITRRGFETNNDKYGIVVIES